ncbi:MAG TPA: preprotein translocase subunit YajC [Gaiellaceae bacterium]
MIIGASGGSGILFIIIIAFLLLYLLFVRPQKRRQNEQQQMISELRVGDEVLTVGGIYGTISQLDDDRVTVEIAPNLEVQVSRRAIAGVTREPDEPEVEESDEAEEPEADEGSAAQTSNEENRG